MVHTHTMCAYYVKALKRLLSRYKLGSSTSLQNKMKSGFETLPQDETKHITMLFVPRAASLS